MAFAGGKIFQTASNRLSGSGSKLDYKVLVNEGIQCFFQNRQGRQRTRVEGLEADPKKNEVIKVEGPFSEEEKTIIVCAHILNVHWTCVMELHMANCSENTVRAQGGAQWENTCLACTRKKTTQS
jgi:hypothetical protein